MSKHRDAAAIMAAQCYCFRARRVARALTRIYDEAFRPLGVQTSQMALLTALSLAPEQGVPLGVMADVLLLDRTTLSRNLRPLESAGLVRVARSRTDKRAKLVLLTAAGQRVVRESFPLWREAQHMVTTALGTGPAAELRKQLDDVVTHVAGAPLPDHLGSPSPKPSPTHRL